MRRSRPVDSEQQLLRLEQRHQQLKQQIAELDRRVFLTSNEQAEMNVLKKHKLATKDEIFSLRNGLSA